MPLLAAARPRHRTLHVFVCLMGALSLVLGVLAWQLLTRDRDAEQVQRQQRLELAAARVATLLQANVQALERAGATPDPGVLPDDVVVMSGMPDAPDVRPAGRLLFLPAGLPAAADQAAAPRALRPAEGLAAAEAVEFRTGGPGAAIALYRRAAQSVESSVAGPALAGLGRVLRKSGRPEDALEVYGALAALGATPVFGLPAELVAREARCSVFAEIGRRDELAAEATEMATALWDRRYVLEESVWAFHLDEATRFGAADARSPDRRDAMVLARAAGWAFEVCQRADGGSRLRRALSIDGEPALVVCRAGDGVPARAIVAGPRYVRALAGEKVLGEALEGMVGGRSNLRMALVDGDRHLAAGALDRNRPSAVQTPDATALPWTIYVSDADDGTGTLLGGRRRFLLAAFAVLGLALGTGSFFIVRSLRRERAAASLQSDFVAAVSHEFRTPLTSIRQLSELLATGRLVGEDRRGQAYAILSEESRRLDRLVESLLDFGRLQAGTHAYQPERISAAELAERAVAEFRGSPRTDGYRFEVLHECEATVRVDPASLALALRNLLDNAVKYSGESRRIRVSTGRDRGSATISVTDDGPGIPPAEQRAVFGAFVRGSGARAAGVRGTGLGLALAVRIVAAHGGDIRVVSEPGRGSTFTILLPAEGSS